MPKQSFEKTVVIEAETLVETASDVTVVEFLQEFFLVADNLQSSFDLPVEDVVSDLLAEIRRQLFD